MDIGNNHLAEGGTPSLNTYLPWIIILILIILALLYIFKKRFGPKTQVYYSRCQTDGIIITSIGSKPWQSSQLEPTSFIRKFTQVINPFGRQKMKVQDVEFRAVDYGRDRGTRVEVLVTKSVIVKRIPGVVTPDEPVSIIDPVGDNPLDTGWQRIGRGQTIAVYSRGNKVTLLQYV